MSTAAASSTDTTLAGVCARFFSHAGPRIIGAVWLAVLLVRLAAGRWVAGYFLAFAVVVALQPFTEWFLHVTVLHFKPKRLFGRTVDPLISRKHRRHHADPWDEHLRLVIMPALITLIVTAIAVPVAVAADKRLGLTLSLGMLTMLWVYEWTHFLIHSHYVPRSRIYRYIWRAHRLHHFKNEHYWFGITSHVGDWVLRTFPSKDAVPTSTTVRTLGVEGAEV